MLLEIRSYKLHPGKRDEFHALLRDGAAPMLARHAIRVVRYGPSLHDPDCYTLMRAYSSLEAREKQLEGFYGSEEWASRFEAPVMAMIESYATVVVEAQPEAVEALTLD